MDFYQIAKQIDPILDSPDPSQTDIATVIEYLNDASILRYVFRRITALKWFERLNENGFLRSLLNPPPPVGSESEFYSISYWSALDYLERVSKECGNADNRQYADQIMEIIRDVTRAENTQRIDSHGYGPWWSFVKILANLPTTAITLNDIELLSQWFDPNFARSLAGDEIGKRLVPNLLLSSRREDWEKAAKTLEIVTRIRRSEKKVSVNRTNEKESHTLLDAYSLNELFRANAIVLGERCGEKAIDILIRRLNEILDATDDDRYSYIWRPAIEAYSHIMGEYSAKDVLLSGLRDVLLAYSKTHIEEANRTVEELLSDRLDLLKRTALYIIGELYEHHGNVFWKLLKPQLFNSNLRHELFRLLKTHFGTFSPDQKEQVVNIIADLSHELKEGVDKDRFNAAIRLRWLEAIRGEGSDRVDRLYEQCFELTGYAPEHPEVSAYIEGGIVEEKAPCSVDDLLGMTIPELVDYLYNYKESGQWKEPTEEGLRAVLKDAVKQRPEKFTKDLHLVFNLDLLPYQYSIIQAFVELSREKTEFERDKVLTFCLGIVCQEAFWQQTDTPTGRLIPTRSWITSAIDDFIKAGANDGPGSFDEKDLPDVEKLLFILLDKESSTATGEQGDSLSEAINTPKGRSLDALFHYAIYKARRGQKKGESLRQTWKTIEHMFDRELEQCKNHNFEFSALAGASILRLLYLSKSWVTKHFNRIFSLEYEKNWRCAIEGYAYVNAVDSGIYRLLRKNGHFDKAVQQEFKDSHIREKIIQNIAVGYLRTFESLAGDRSLFARVLRSWQEKDIRDIISFFWMLRDSKQRKIRQRILNFWKWCYKKTKGREESNQKILSDLNLLAVFLNKLTKSNKNWLLQSAPYVDISHHSSFFLEYVDQLVGQNPEAVGEIYLKVLTRTTPLYKTDEVRSIVEKLYKKGLTDKANDISNEYARRGHPELLRDIYFTYNS